MLNDALNRIDLYCTACRSFTAKPVQHKLKLVPGEIDGKFVITGHLDCPNCGRQYPVLEGVPHFIEGVPSPAGLTAQYLDAQYGPSNEAYWKKMALNPPGDIHLDIGCGTGRYTFQCAEHSFAVGMDVNAAHLKRAAAFQRGDKITYQRKIRELAEQEEFSHFKASENVLFILADAHNPPFGIDTFTSISALNVIDSVQHPLTVLGQADAMLKSGGQFIISSPYCWDEKSSQEWLETADTAPHDFLLQILTGQRLTETGFNYRILKNRKGISWRLRKHNTLLFTYSVDLIIARKM